jgi:Uma2 family endonuclease
MNTLSAREITEESSYAGRFRKISSRRIEKKIIYPDRDGKPMSDNTEQFEWIVKIKENLEQMFADNPDVFVAGDLLWYPVEGDNRIRTAPDAMVAFGRPKGRRGSYRMWEEGGIAPQVVFEILSPGNRAGEMRKKFVFYDTYGVSEYYVYDPDRIRLSGWIRRNNVLNPVENMQGWISPLLKIRFELAEDDLHIFRPDGKKFLSPVESERLHKKEIRNEQMKAETERMKSQLAEKRAETERMKSQLAEKKAEAEHMKSQLAEQKADAEYQRAEAERLRAERLAAKLRELGIEAD